MIRESESERLMQNTTNVRITVDTEITDYNNRALGSEEAHYTSLAVDESIKVTATGSITEVGSTENTYSISWDSADSSNYTVSESLGTLRVTAQKGAVTLTSASAEKTFDGTALTDSSVTAEGLPSGFTVSATVSGSQTDAGSSANTIDSYTIYNADGTDVTGQFTNVTLQSGTLTVNPLPVEFDLGFRGEVDGDGGSGDGGSDSGDGGSSPAVLEYMGHTYFPEWIPFAFSRVVING